MQVNINPSLSEIQNELEVFELVDFSITLEGQLNFTTITFHGDIEYFEVTPSNPEYFLILKELQEEYCRIQRLS